jgi:hypothetical protein
MAPLSRLGAQLTQVTTALREMGVRYALIGGLALAPHHVIRATQLMVVIEALCPRWPPREPFAPSTTLLL